MKIINQKKNFSVGKKFVCILLGVAFLAGSNSAHGFWFICTYNDAVKAAKVAAKARVQYHDYLSNGNTSERQIRACKMAWDLLREATFGQIKQFAQEVPGTSITGPTNLKKLITKAVKEAIKEALGEISGNPNEGLPSLTESFVLPSGEFVGTPAFDSIPISVSDSNLNITSLNIWTPDLYDGSQGPPPRGSSQAPPMIMIEGTFSNVPIGSYPIFAATPASSAFPMTTYTVDKLALDITTTSVAGIPMNTRLFHAGIFDSQLIAALQAVNPGVDFSKVLTASQVSFVEITSVDTTAETISGNFFSSTGTNLPPDLIINAIQVDASGNVTSVNLDWNALPGSTFDVECSLDLQQFSIYPSGQGVIPPFTVVVPPGYGNAGFFHVRETVISSSPDTFILIPQP